MARRFLSGALGTLLRYALVIGTLGGVGSFWYVILDDLVAAERSSGAQDQRQRPAKDVVAAD